MKIITILILTQLSTSLITMLQKSASEHLSPEQKEGLERKLFEQRSKKIHEVTLQQSKKNKKELEFVAQIEQVLGETPRVDQQSNKIGGRVLETRPTERNLRKKSEKIKVIFEREEPKPKKEATKVQGGEEFFLKSGSKKN